MARAKTLLIITSKMTRFLAHLIVLAFVLVVSGSRPTPPSILKTDILLQLDLATKLSQCSDDER